MESISKRSAEADMEVAETHSPFQYLPKEVPEERNFPATLETHAFLPASQEKVSLNQSKVNKIKVDTKLLICAIEEKKCIWDVSSEDYKNRYMESKAFMDVAAVVVQNFEKLNAKEEAVEVEQEVEVEAEVEEEQEHLKRVLMRNGYSKSDIRRAMNPKRRTKAEEQPTQKARHQIKTIFKPTQKIKNLLRSAKDKRDPKTSAGV
nr:unnamed protein product [Callosobruchus chinensis]